MLKILFEERQLLLFRCRGLAVCNDRNENCNQVRAPVDETAYSAVLSSTAIGFPKRNFNIDDTRFLQRSDGRTLIYFSSSEATPKAS